MKVTVIHYIKDERVKDLLCCALEGGSNHWYLIKEYRYPPGQTEESLKMEFPHLDLPFLDGGALIIGDKEDEADKHPLDRAAMEQGLQLMASKPELAKHMADFIAENEDATTGDVFLQICLYGEERFG